MVNHHPALNPVNFNFHPTSLKPWANQHKPTPTQSLQHIVVVLIFYGNENQAETLGNSQCAGNSMERVWVDASNAGAPRRAPQWGILWLNKQITRCSAPSTPSNRILAGRLKWFQRKYFHIYNVDIHTYGGHHHILQSQPRVRRYWEERVIYEAESLIDAIAALHDDRCRM